VILSENIHIRAEFIIEKDNVERFKILIREMSHAVERNEPSTLVYQFYLNGDGTRCMVHETYVDSEATLSHNDGSASKQILPRIFIIAKLTTLDVYGNPSNELKKLLTSFNSQIFNLYAGLNRKNE
jgi:quinol monooxygenase YgiN